MSTYEIRKAEKARKKEARNETLGAAKNLLKNVQELRRGAATMRDSVAKREQVPTASNFRMDKKTQKKIEEKVRKAFDESSPTSKSLPKIKKSQSGSMSPRKLKNSQSGSMSPRKLKNSQSNIDLATGTVSPKKVKRNKSDVLRTSQSSSQISNIKKGQKSPPKNSKAPIFSIGSPGEELASPGEPAIINDEKISIEKFRSVQHPVTRQPEMKSQSTSDILATAAPKRKFGKTLNPHYNMTDDAVPFTARTGKVYLYFSPLFLISESDF